MTDHTDTDRPRLIGDGGTETLSRTVEAKDVVTREVDGDDVEMLRVPISSTRSDREGDRFSKAALEGMAEQIQDQQPMVFDNHGLAGSFMEAIPYDSRETIGAQMDAEVEPTDDGEYELLAYINPDGSHPEGERLVEQVAEEKQPIKFSVGFRILDSDSITDDAGNEIGREFTTVDEMETSRVGIPANPDASTPQQMSAKGASPMTDLPGYQKHPVFRMLMGDDESGSGTVSKSVEDGTDPGPVDEKTDKVEGGCETDDECPDGEVCVEGECIPEEDLDAEESEETDGVTCSACDADVSSDAKFCSQCGAELGADDDKAGEGTTEETADKPDHIRDMESEIDDLRAEIQEYREAAEADRGASETGDTNMSDTTAGYPDAETEADADDESTEEKDTAEGDAGKPLTEQFR